MSKSVTYKVIFVDVPFTRFVKSVDPTIELTGDQAQQRLFEESLVQSKCDIINALHPTWNAESGNPGTNPPPLP